MRPVHYRFDARWELAAAPEVVFDRLADLEHYARWWPQVRRVVGIDEETARVEIRSLLPYSLHCTLFRAVECRESARLVAELEGDLTGFAGWQLRPDGTGTVATYEQEVHTTVPWMNAAAALGRPVFRWNHAAMMRSGRNGLASLLGG